MQMDFSSETNGSIDYSPFRTLKLYTIVLCEEELVTCEERRFERFWSVWYKERHTYARLLQHLTIVLRPQYKEGRSITEGIQRFLNFFYGSILFNTIREGLTIYIDNIASDDGGKRFTTFADAPTIVYDYNAASHIPELHGHA